MGGGGAMEAWGDAGRGRGRGTEGWGREGYGREEQMSGG
jgi:hypothetical protein